MNEKPQLSIEARQIAALVEEHVAMLASTLRPDYLAALEAALATETSSRGREVLGQLVANAHLAKSEGLPLCQDTGYVWVCLEVNGAVQVPADAFSEVDAAVARATRTAGMRASLVHDALLDRSNTTNNSPALTSLLMNKGIPSWLSPAFNSSPTDASAYLHIMLKGGGSDNASAVAMLPPSAGIAGVSDFVTEAVAAKAANACPPLVVGVGVGGSFDSVASLAKYALLRPLGSAHLVPEISDLEAELLVRINSLGIGPGGLGGSTTALGVHINSAGCHIAALPVAVNVGCTALRSTSLDLGDFC